jgi:hypothetical protein
LFDFEQDRDSAEFEALEKLEADLLDPCLRGGVKSMLEVALISKLAITFDFVGYSYEIGLFISPVYAVGC